MFELFNVPNTMLVPKSVLSLYSYGITSGLMVHSGYEDTQIVPIFEGYPLQYAVRKMPLGGYHVSQYLMQLLADRGYGSDGGGPIGLEDVTNIKEKYCYLSIDYERELASLGRDKEQAHTLPDGKVIKINSEA